MLSVEAEYQKEIEDIKKEYAERMQRRQALIGKGKSISNFARIVFSLSLVS